MKSKFIISVLSASVIHACEGIYKTWFDLFIGVWYNCVQKIKLNLTDVHWLFYFMQDVFRIAEFEQFNRTSKNLLILTTKIK